MVDPTQFSEAVKSSKWKASMDAEMEAIMSNKTWELCALPEGKKTVGLKWIYKTKLNAEGQVLKLKARIVAKGYSQQQGIDYEEVFSPVARLETVRLVLAFAAQHGWEVHQFDVKSAFLNGEIREDVYVSQPEGYVEKGKEHLVCKLSKALYGLKQAPRAWYSKIDQYFREIGLRKSKSEHTLYQRQGEDGETLVVSLYVDDIIYTSSLCTMLKEFKNEMMHKFNMTDLGVMGFFLGIEVKQNSDGIFICQRSYIEDVLSKLNMQQCKPVPTPMAVNEKLEEEGSEEFTDPFLFRSTVGKLLYICHTRPDIVYSVNYLSRFMSRPSKVHFSAVKRVVRYLAGSKNFGLWYSHEGETTLEIFSDSD